MTFVQMLLSNIALVLVLAWLLVGWTILLVGVRHAPYDYRKET